MIAMDLDGTLWDAPEDHDIEDPEGLRKVVPHAGAVKFARAQGKRILYLSGRGASHRQIIVRILSRLGLEGRLVLREGPWRGMAAYVDYKVAELRRHKCVVYVGDLPEDADIAARAGVRFLHASLVRTNPPLEAYL